MVLLEPVELVELVEFDLVAFVVEFPAELEELVDFIDDDGYVVADEDVVAYLSLFFLRFELPQS